MSDRKHAEVEGIVAVSQGVRGTAELTAEAAAYAGEANPDAYMWGAVGAPLAQAYELGAVQIQLAFHRFPAAFEGLAKKLEDCARDIADNDDEISRSFDELNSAGER